MVNFDCTPPQQANILFDTGSPNAFILSNQCSRYGCPPKTKGFNTQASSTFLQKAKSPTTINFGIGAVWGFVASDSFCMDADSCFNLKFLDVKMASGIPDLSYHGLLGLALKSDSLTIPSFIS